MTRDRGERTGPRGGNHTIWSSLGANYLIRGHDLKLNLDWSRIGRAGTATDTDFDVMTVQLQLGL